MVSNHPSSDMVSGNCEHKVILIGGERAGELNSKGDRQGQVVHDSGQYMTLDLTPYFRKDKLA